MSMRFMIDIETTGTDSSKDFILQVAVVPVEDMSDGFIQKKSFTPSFVECLYYPGKPETLFAKEHMSELYTKCNQQPTELNTEWLRVRLKNFLFALAGSAGPYKFIGWNARGLDLEFLIKFGVLAPSTYEVRDGRERLVGDVHYQIDEMAGMISLLTKQMNLPWHIVKEMALKCVPPLYALAPKGISHDALDDCFYQINLYNGMIALARKGWTL